MSPSSYLQSEQGGWRWYPVIINVSLIFIISIAIVVVVIVIIIVAIINEHPHLSNQSRGSGVGTQSASMSPPSVFNLIPCPKYKQNNSSDILTVFFEWVIEFNCILGSLFDIWLILQAQQTTRDNPRITFTKEEFYKNRENGHKTLYYT